MADQNTFIHVLRLDGKGSAYPVSTDTTADWKPEDGVLWLHMDYTKEVARKWLREESGLDPLVAEALIAEDTRPRALPVGGGLLGILRGVNLNPGPEPDDMVSIRLWIESGRVITTRMRDLISVNDIIDSLEQGTGPHQAEDFLIVLIGRLVWRMSDTVDNLEELVSEIEEAVLDTPTQEYRRQLALLRRQTITLRRYLSPQREALTRLINEKISWIDERDRHHLMEIHDRLTRHIEDLDVVSERASLTQEEILSRLSDQLNRRMYLLALIAAIFLPLSFLTGLLGINVAGIPGANYPHAFMVFATLLIIIVSLQFLYFKWKRWF